MLDAATIFVVSILADVLFCLCGLLLWRAQLQIPGMLPLALTFAARGTGLFLLVLAPALNSFISLWVGNVLLTLSGVLMLEGFARFLGQAPPRRLQLLLLLGVAVTWPLLLWLRPEDITLRISILAFASMLCYGRCALLFLRDATQPVALRRVTVAWSTTIALIGAAWGVSAWFAPSKSLLDPNPLLSLYMLMHLLSFLVKGVMTAILVGVRLRAQLLARIDEERAQLLMLSHELRTPIAIASRSSELLATQDGGADPAATRRVDQIRCAIARMSALVEQFLAETREIERHDMPERFDLAAEIRNLASSPRLALDLPERLPFTGDRRMIGIIFSNIVDNALKYSPAQSLVDVYLTERNGRAMLTVEDRGLGLGPDGGQSRLGERFYRAPNTDGIPGVGLGLYTVRKLLATRGGAIALRPREGGGTVVSIEFGGVSHAG